MPEPDPNTDLPAGPGGQILQALLRRRSIAPRRLLPPGPSLPELHLMARAAARAPDHGGLQPWRFRLIAGPARQALAEACAAALAQEMPDAPPALLEREREKIAAGPTLVAVMARIVEDHPEVPAAEQQASIGAAILGFLLAAEAMGHAGIMLSGRRVRRPALRAALGLAQDQHLAGFLTLGRADRSIRPPNPPPADLFAAIDRPEALRGLMTGG